MTLKSNSACHCRLRVTLNTTDSSDVARRLECHHTRRFGKWIFFPPSVQARFTEACYASVAGFPFLRFRFFHGISCAIFGA